MVASLRVVGTAALAFAGEALAKKFSVADSYDSTNFFDKFDFIDLPDNNSGHVRYLNKQDALAQGIAAYQDNEVYLGVDHKTVLPGSGSPGRPSFRIESKAEYKHGLIVARFSHLPKNTCGSWPAFWTLGADWPNGGEIDLYEGWNEATENQPALHAGSAATYGACTLDGSNQTSPVSTSNCDNTFEDVPRQYRNQGCAVHEDGPWASPNGGTYAMEWTNEYVKLYTWRRGQEPADIGDAQPDTATWGTPSLNLKNATCDIDRHFGAQRLILDIAFCGIPVGMDVIWKQTCAAATKQDTCVDYVSKSPEAFKESFFKIQDIRYFKEVETPTSTSASTSAPSTSATSTTVSSTSSLSTTSKPIASSSSTTSSSLTSSIMANTTTSLTSSIMANTTTSGGASTTSASSRSETLTSTSSMIPTTVHTSAHSNGTWFGAPTKAAPALPGGMTTSVVYKTEVKTVTGCPPWVNACPGGSHVTTIVVPLYTTVCPVDAVETPAVKQPAPVGKQPAPADKQQNPADKQQNPADKQQNPADKQQNPADKQQSPADKQQNPADKQQAPGAKDAGAAPPSTTTVTVFQERTVTVFPTAEASCLVAARAEAPAPTPNKAVPGAEFFEPPAAFRPSKRADGEVKLASGAGRASAGLFAVLVASVAMLI